MANGNFPESFTDLLGDVVNFDTSFEMNSSQGSTQPLGFNAPIQPPTAPVPAPYQPSAEDRERWARHVYKPRWTTKTWQRHWRETWSPQDQILVLASILRGRENQPARERPTLGDRALSPLATEEQWAQARALYQQHPDVADAATAALKSGYALSPYPAQMHQVAPAPGPAPAPAPAQRRPVEDPVSTQPTKRQRTTGPATAALAPPMPRVRKNRATYGLPRLVNVAPVQGPAPRPFQLEIVSRPEVVGLGINFFPSPATALPPPVPAITNPGPMSTSTVNDQNETSTPIPGPTTAPPPPMPAVITSDPIPTIYGRYLAEATTSPYLSPPTTPEAPNPAVHEWFMRRRGNIAMEIKSPRLPTIFVEPDFHTYPAARPNPTIDPQLIAIRPPSPTLVEFEDNSNADLLADMEVEQPQQQTESAQSTPSLTPPALTFPVPANTENNDITDTTTTIPTTDSLDVFSPDISNTDVVEDEVFDDDFDQQVYIVLKEACERMDREAAAQQTVPALDQQTA